MKWRIKRTTLLTVGLFAFLCGLGLARLGTTLLGSWWWLSAALVILLIKRKSHIALPAIILLGVVAGITRGQAAMSQMAPLNDLYEQKVIFTAVAESDGTYSKRSQLSFDVSDVHITEPLEVAIPGKIKVEGFGEAAVYRGDIVEIEGKLWRSRGSRVAGVSYAEISVHGRNYGFIEDTRKEFIAGMQTALPEPQASFASGLLIGQRTTMPDATVTALAAVGLTHIVAVSGYNLTIIVRAVRRLMHRRSKYQATIAMIVLISLFVLFTGFSASIVRAALVSMLSIWAWYYGRTFKPVLLIALVAALTSAWNPLYLWSDIGWYLSFLAFFGILVLAPLITQRFWRRKQPGILGSVLIETFCAQLLTAPLIIYIFKEISVISIVANMIIVPLVPLAMLFGLIAGIAGMLLPALSGWPAWPARVLLTYMLDIINLLARVPSTLVQRVIGLPTLMMLYGLILSVCIVLWHKIKQKNGKITEKAIIEF